MKMISFLLMYILEPWNLHEHVLFVLNEGISTVYVHEQLDMLRQVGRYVEVMLLYAYMCDKEEKSLYCKICFY